MLAEFGTVPKRHLAAVAALGLVSASLTAVVIRTEPDTWVSAILLAPLTIVYVWLTYATTMAMLPTNISIVGAIKFGVTGLALFFPSLVSFGLLLLIGRSSSIVGLILLLALFAFTFVVVPILYGWPVMQAASARWVGPRAALRRTRGIRWQLVIASMVVSGTNRGLPRASPSDDLWVAALMVFLEAVISTFSLLLVVSISVAAWRHMTARDLNLASGLSSDEGRTI